MESTGLRNVLTALILATLAAYAVRAPVKGSPAAPSGSAKTTTPTIKASAFVGLMKAQRAALLPDLGPPDQHQDFGWVHADIWADGTKEYTYDAPHDVHEIQWGGYAGVPPPTWPRSVRVRQNPNGTFVTEYDTGDIFERGHDDIYDKTMMLEDAARTVLGVKSQVEDAQTEKANQEKWEAETKLAGQIPVVGWLVGVMNGINEAQVQADIAAAQASGSVLQEAQTKLAKYGWTVRDPGPNLL